MKLLIIKSLFILIAALTLNNNLIGQSLPQLNSDAKF